MLPASGLLSFFIEFDKESDDYSQTEEKESYRTFLFEGDLKRVAIEREVQWKTASLEANAEWTFSEDVPADFDFRWIAKKTSGNDI